MEQALLRLTPKEKQLQLADKIKKIRKSEKITQKRLAILSGVTYSSIRRFEETGEISLNGFIKILFALDLYDVFDQLLSKSIYKTLEDAIKWLISWRLNIETGW